MFARGMLARGSLGEDEVVVTAAGGEQAHDVANLVRAGLAVLTPALHVDERSATTPARGAPERGVAAVFGVFVHVWIIGTSHASNVVIRSELRLNPQPGSLREDASLRRG